MKRLSSIAEMVEYLAGWGNLSEPDYDPASYWSNIIDKIGRDLGRDLAFDDTSTYLM